MTTFRVTRSTLRNLRKAGTASVLSASVLLGSAALTSPVDAAPAVVPAPAEGVSVLNLREGATGPGVEAVQTKLISFGYVIRDKLGVFGANTTKVLRTFQQQNGLNPTGVVTENTAKYLGMPGGTVAAPEAAAPAAASSNTGSSSGGSSSPAPTSGYVGLRFGSTGESVKVLQQKLTGLGLVVNVDGVFGRSTERGVKMVQRVNGLTETGVVTEKVAGILGLAGSTSAGTASSSNAGSTAPTSGYVGLRYGSRGESVRVLQQKLRGLGLVLVGDSDGVFGRSTERGVKAVERVNGLTQTGVVSEKVAAILGLTGTPSAAAAAPSAAGSVLEYGSKGAAVQRVQQLLMGAGYSVIGGADGVFGVNTRGAVRQFQGSNGLSVTGKVDAATDKALTAAGGNANGGTATPVVPAAPRSSSAATIAVQAAMGQVGVPYRFGAALPGVAFDCSGLTAWAWRQAGVALPYHSGLQYQTLPHVSASDARPGDLLFFHSPISHVGMYVGNGKMVDATQPGSTVVLRSVRWSSVVGVGRPA